MGGSERHDHVLLASNRPLWPCPMVRRPARASRLFAGQSRQSQPGRADGHPNPQSVWLPHRPGTCEVFRSPAGPHNYRFWVPMGQTRRARPPTIGGSRVLTVISDRDNAVQLPESRSDPIADSGRLAFLRPGAGGVVQNVRICAGRRGRGRVRAGFKRPRRGVPGRCRGACRRARRFGAGRRRGLDPPRVRHPADPYRGQTRRP